ncbi:hypothetical protein [Nonomuraea jiangxiensis]|uniref:Peptidase inhibitor family I36 n=1 Tax=Nonomuraea jiangxiensis TaxID=633440 RepID=A0A1G8WM73_9ACTN|nr:hypothetical protein [Nonomuraea jiangxiensis]SDJ79206.1 hypothetical protein SAMN05421869_112208 [Nonomuraea jiangxiensis]
MRFVSRILIGVAAATVVAIGAPVAANASTTSATSATDYSDDWGPYFSSDHKAKASGHVSVDQKRFKHWFWKWVPVKKWVCEDDHKGKDDHKAKGEHKGEKDCHWVVKKVKKHTWEWRYESFYTVHSTLQNNKWWGKRNCAWETFKVVNLDGSSYFKSFSNCSKRAKEFSFFGRNAAHIYVDVSTGPRHGPSGYHSGWEDVYHAAA